MKKKYLIIILVILILLSVMIVLLTKTNYIRYITSAQKNEKIVKDIIFEPYSLNNNKLKILVVAQDTENTLESLSYQDENGDIINKIDCNNKNKVSLDIEINENKKYIFVATNSIGEEIVKELIIDDEYKNSIINIQISIDENTIDSEGKALKGNVEINYGNNENLKMETQYKIGKGDWNYYNGTIDIDCNEIVSNSLQENDNRTINIYARKIDKNGNEISTMTKTDKFDVDAPAMPEITIEQKASYPILTSEGICLDNTVTIKFDDTLEKLVNQYSVDGGNTWETCDNGVYTFNTIRGKICAKSTKQTGLTITKMVNVSMNNVTSSSALASDALGYKAYDGDTSTYIGAYYGGFWEGSSHDIRSIGGYMLVDESAYNKKMNVYFSRTGSSSSGSSSPKGDIRIYCYDENETVLSTTIINRNQSGIGTQTIQIPENTKKIYFYMIITDTGWSGGSGYARIHNIEI